MGGKVVCPRCLGRTIYGGKDVISGHDVEISCLHCDETGFVDSEDEQRATAHGKEVCLDGEHFADAVSPEAAAVICDCINFAGLPADRWPTDANERVIRFFQ